MPHGPSWVVGLLVVWVILVEKVVIILDLQKVPENAEEGASC